MAVYVVFNKKGIQRICSKAEFAEKWANVLDCDFGEYQVDDEFPYPDGACYGVWKWDGEYPSVQKVMPDQPHPVMVQQNGLAFCRIWATSEDEALATAKDMINKGAAD